MKQELQNKLYEKYPKIFQQKDLPMTQTAMCWGISCGDGWFNIIDTLCGHLQYLVDHPHEEIAMYQRWIEKEKLENKPAEVVEGINGSWTKMSSEEKIVEYEARIKEYKKKIIPQLEAAQVKEKYGSLRFYLSEYPSEPEADAKVTAYINFAESISHVTCEDCGKPGDQRGSHWTQTLCESCEEERSNQWAKAKEESMQLKLPFPESSDTKRNRNLKER